VNNFQRWDGFDTFVIVTVFLLAPPWKWLHKYQVHTGG